MDRRSGDAVRARLPKDFVPSALAIATQARGAANYTLGPTSDTRLFAYCVFLERDLTEVQVHARLDRQAAEASTGRAQVVNGTRRYQRLAGSAADEAVRPDFLLQVLEFGSRLAGLG